MSQSTLAPPEPRVARPIKRWSIDEFDRLMTEGFLREGSRTYLWDGEIIEPMPENPPHILAVNSLLDLLKALFPAVGWSVFQNAPLLLQEYYKPQPDLLVLKGQRSSFRGRLATPADVVLLVEVSSTTYCDDVGACLRKYAECLVPNYWIVNVSLRRVEVYEEPAQDPSGSHSYYKQTYYGLDASVPIDVTYAGARVTGQIPVIDILRDSLEPAEGEAHA